MSVCLCLSICVSVRLCVCVIQRRARFRQAYLQAREALNLPAPSAGPSPVVEGPAALAGEAAALRLALRRLIRGGDEA